MSTNTVPEPGRRGRPAVFLDRDGVLIEDMHLLHDPATARILTGVPEALSRLHDAGLVLVVATNQTVVSRGEATMSEVAAANRRVGELISAAGGPMIDGWYVCPHHPQATLAEYRVECACRKPRPGLLRRAADERGLQLERSFMVGDRITDIAAGRAAGCATILVHTGAHTQPPIVTVDPLPEIEPDYQCRDLLGAADWILGVRG